MGVSSVEDYDYARQTHGCSLNEREACVPSTARDGRYGVPRLTAALPGPTGTAQVAGVG